MKLLLATLYISLCQLVAAAFFAVLVLLLGVGVHMAVEDWPVPLYALGIVLGILAIGIGGFATFLKAQDFIDRNK